MNLLEHFVDPPREYSPVPFWFLNEKLDAARLEWQLEQMHAQHVYGAVMHARPGLVDAYLSDEWFEHIGTIVRTARRLGMFTWIYDEYPWMSGMAEWRVPQLHDDFRIRAIDRLARRVKGPASHSWDFRAELPDDAGAVVSVLAAPVYPDGTVGSARELQPREGRLRVDLGPGDHLVSVCFERYSYSPYVGPHGREAVTDLMHPAAVRAFISLTHEEYERRFADYLGSTIRAVFTDEPPANTPGWSRGFLAEFERRKGYDLRPHLTLLWENDSRAARQVRFDYGDVASALYEESFFGQLESWADRAGIASTGHVLLEETLPLHVRFMGDYFRSERRLHYPGIDYIFPGEIPAITCKLVASVAKLSGRERVMSECFALTGWDFHPAHMKWMTDWQVVNGVDLLVPHAFFYATSEREPIPEMRENLGFRWYDCPPSMFYQQPYWPFYHRYADYLRRLCYTMTRGRHVCSIAVYYPIETVQADYIATREYCDLSLDEIPGTWMTADYLWDGTPMEQTDAHFRWLGNELRAHGFDYDVVDDDTLRASTTAAGALRTPVGSEYRVLILPRAEMLHADVYRTIETFVREGGSVIATGCLPKHACEGPALDFQIQRISRSIFTPSAGADRASFHDRPDDALLDRLRATGAADARTGAPGIYAQHRRDGDVDLYYLVNHRRYAPVRASIWLRGAGTPLVLDPYEGASAEPAEWRAEAEGVRIELALDANESLFVVIAPTGTLPAAPRVRGEPDRLVPAGDASGPWRLTIEPGDPSPERVRDMPERPRFDELPREQRVDTLQPWEELGLAEFSGEAVYETTFDATGISGSGDWYVDLGEVGVAAELTVNGVDCGVRLWPPYRFPITAAIQEGANTIRVRVANTLANAVQATYGGGAVPTTAEAWQVEHFARFGDGRLRSGLIGPVRLLRVSG